MTTCQIITKAGHLITGLGPWRHNDKGRNVRIFKAVMAHERIEPWAYITFTEWTRSQACVLAKMLNDALVYRHWQVHNHPRLNIIIYYEPHLLSHRGPDQFEISTQKYHYPYDKCIIAGNWFKVRGTNVHASISDANSPHLQYRYALDPVHGHIIYRAL